MKSRMLSMLLCLTLVLSLLPVTVLAATEICSVDIINVPQPKVGNPVPVSATVTTAGAALYSMDWYDKTAGRFLESNDSFIENHIYEVQLWVEAKSGYAFRTNGTTPDVSAAVGGKTAKVSKAYEYQAWAMVVVSYTFDPCPKKEIKSVDIQLDGITKSGNVLLAEEGKGIPFSIQSGDEQVKLYPELHTRYYPYGFRWSNLTKDTTAYDGDRFQGGCDYYVTVALKPRNSDYVFADDFTATIGGQEATIKSLGTTYAEIAVRLTCYGTITAGNINPAVSLPIAGNAPDYGLYYGSCEHIDYASISGWYDVESGAKISSDDKFYAGKQYRVEVTCMAAYGYKFQRDANDKMEYTPMITGQKVDSYSFGYDSYRARETVTLVKTYTLSGPAQTHTHTPSPWRITGAYHYKACTACGDFLEQEDHKWSSEYYAVGEKGHACQCTECKTYDTVQEHVPGPAGTPDAAVVCRDCGYIITPEKDHKHTLTRVEQVTATCLQPGTKAHYTCSGCSDKFADPEGKTRIPETELSVSALGHSTGQSRKKDTQCHWFACTACGEVLPETRLAHEFRDGICTVCGYREGDPVAPEEPTEKPAKAPAEAPETPTEGSPEREGPNWLLIGLIAAACLSLAAVAVVLLRKRKK